MRDRLILGLVWLVSTLGAAFALMDSSGPPRVVAGFVLAMFAPGYALVAALRPHGMAAAERVSLSVPLSLVLAALNGVVADRTPFGLNTTPILVGLWAITTALTVVAAIRLMPQPASTRTAYLFRPGLGWPRLAAATLALVLAAGWAFMSFTEAARATPQPFTALAIDMPSSISIGNQEQHPMSYDVEEQIDGNVVWRTDDLHVDSGGEQTLPIAVMPASGQTMDVLLYQHGDSTVYRQVHVGSVNPS